jgi:hypothetical protein
MNKKLQLKVGKMKKMLKVKDDKAGSMITKMNAIKSKKGVKKIPAGKKGLAIKGLI